MLSVLAARRASRAASRRRPKSRSHRRFQLESLERRLLLSIVNPIDPGSGEANLLDIIDALPLNDITSALNSFPVPYVVVASANGAEPTIANNRAGAPTRLDADRSKTTGKGGNDIQVEVNTELLPTPHLVLDISRLGGAPFAQDLSVIIAFPFSAFTNEALPGAPNLFMGFETRLAGGDNGMPGGIAPLHEKITFTPHILAGTNHTFDLAFDTTGASNPLTFLAGHFDGTSLTGILDADAISAYVQNVPSHIGVGLTVNENALVGPTTDTFFDISWSASARSLVTFDYLENESFPFTTPDFNTTLTIDQMPTIEHLTLSLDEMAGTLTLAHDGNAVINRATLLKERADGLTIIGTATDIPTHVALSLDLSGSVDLDVNANTLDLELQALQDGGFFDTSDFLGYDLGYASVRLMDVPDLHAEWSSDTDSFEVMAVNPGESIGAVEVVIDDDAHFGAIVNGAIDANADGMVNGDDDGTVAGFALIDGLIDVNGDGIVDATDDGTAAGFVVTNGLFDVNGDGFVNGLDDLSAFLVGLATPPSYFEGLPGQPGELHHLFSVVDDGTHGTAVARILRVSEAKLDLDPDASQVFHLETAAPAGPMQVYLKFGEGSHLIDPDPNADIEITCDIDDVPFGVFDIHFDALGSFGYTTDPAQTIDSIHCFGHVGTLNFDIDAGGLPPVFDFDFDPDSHVTIFAEDGFGGPAFVGHVAARFFDMDGPGLPFTAGLLGTTLRDARMRVDQIPSSHAMWTLVRNVSYDGGSGALPSVGDVLFDAATGSTAIVLEVIGSDPATGMIKIGFIETDATTAFSDNDVLDVLDALAVDEQTRDFAVGQMVTGESSGATAIVHRADQIGGTGVIYLSDVSGTFADNENLLVAGDTVAKANGTLQTAPTWTAQVNGALEDAGTLMDFDSDATDVFLGGVQFLVSTKVELEDPLPVADPTAPDFAKLEEEDTPDGLVQRLGAGVFGIDTFHLDTFSSLNLHYDANEAHLLTVHIERTFGGLFFPAGADFDYDLTFTIDSVPQTYDLTSDLMTQFVYEGSSGISSITLLGTVDDTDDGMANGTQVTFALLGLPSEVRFGIITAEVEIINGDLDTDGNGIVDGADDAMLAGVRVINGRLDMDGNGVVDASDDGTFFGIQVSNGRLNVDGDGDIDGDDDGAVAGAELFMNGGISTIGLLLESVDNAFGLVGDSPFHIFQALATDIPAQWVLSYGAGRFLLDTRDETGAPDPLGEIQALVSTTNDTGQNNDKALPFTQDGPIQGGAVLGDPSVVGGGGPGGSRINYSEFLQEIDTRFYNEGIPTPTPNGVLIRLAELYADSEQLDAGEDHLLVRKDGDDVDFASFQFTGFQHLSWTPNANGGQFVFEAPGRGDLPFFGGYEDADVFSTLQIEHIPDHIDFDLDKTEHLTYSASASPGEIDFYQGPATDDGLFAGDGDDAMRAIMRNTPTEVRIFWTFSFPSGGAFFDASNPFELLFLTQDGSSRITAGLSLEDLEVAYGIELLSFDVTNSLTIPNPLPFCGDLVIPIAWALFEAKAGIDNDADGLTLADLGDLDLSDIGANLAKASVAGFFSLYTFESNPSDLVDPALAAPAEGSYVPQVSVMTEGFREFSMDFLVELDPTNPSADLYPIDLEFTIDTSNIGNLVLDIWSTADTDETFSIPLVGEVGFVNPPDYTDNTPFHILPGLFGDLGDIVANGLKGLHHVEGRDPLVFTWDGFHAFAEHFDPFAGTPAPFTGSSGTGSGVDTGDVEFLINALGQFAAALTRWEVAISDEFVIEGFTEEEANIMAMDLVNPLANNTLLEISDLGDAILGTATGDATSATIQIDPDAGGFVWFIDTTPGDDTEFPDGGPPPASLTAPAGDANGKVDMLTFMLHEIGHLLGLDHATAGVMQSTLPRSTRRLPVAADFSADPPGMPAPDADDIAALRVEVTQSSAPATDAPAPPSADVYVATDSLLQPQGASGTLLYTFDVLQPPILQSASSEKVDAVLLDSLGTPRLLVRFDDGTSDDGKDELVTQELLTEELTMV